MSRKIIFQDTANHLDEKTKKSPRIAAGKSKPILKKKSQLLRFKAKAKELAVDETGEMFERAFKKIIGKAKNVRSKI